MRVYFSGSHSSGKSTLARYVSEKYKLPMITEVARAVLSERELQIDTLRHDLDVVDSYQRAIFDRQILEESKQESFVSDRSALDALAYCAMHSRILHQLIISDTLFRYVERLKEDDVRIFFVRASKITMKDDGVRESLSWEGALAIDHSIKFLLQQFNLDYFQISMDSMQERVKFVDAILKHTTS